MVEDKQCVIYFLCIPCAAECHFRGYSLSSAFQHVVHPDNSFQQGVALCLPAYIQFAVLHTLRHSSSRQSLFVSD